jgi:hypothetical protein
MTNEEIVRAELKEHGIKLCGGCDLRQSHRRGFAVTRTRTIHLSQKMATAATLYGFMHEVGHIVRGHRPGRGLRRWEQEREAEDYARERFRALGLPLPAREVERGDAYVARMKRWGDRALLGRTPMTIVPLTA